MQAKINCPVPSRDPQRARHRRLPEAFQRPTPRNSAPWAAATRFDHFYRLAVNTRVAPAETGKPLRIGDALVSERR